MVGASRECLIVVDRLDLSFFFLSRSISARYFWMSC